MKHATRALLLISFLSSPVAFAADPFMQTWYYNDGLATYHLTIMPSTAPNQTHHIEYTFPEGVGSSDMCHLTASDHFTCYGTESGQLDFNLHAVKFHHPVGDFVYYDQQYMPINDGILGTWRYQRVDSYGTTKYEIQIAKGDDDSHFLVSGKMADSNGNHCGDLGFTTFTSQTNADGTRTLIHDQGAWGKHLVHYDPINNQIDNANPEHLLKIGSCLNLDHNPVVFKKG